MRKSKSVRERFIESTLTVEEVSTLLGIGVRTVWRWESIQKMPASKSFGHWKRWDKQEIDDWVNSGCPDQREIDIKKKGEQ